MTFRSRTLKTVAIAIAIIVLGAPTAFATQFSYRERQAIASRGIGAPTPKVVAPKSVGQLDTARATSSGGADWAAIAAFGGLGIAALIALLALGRRRAPATPR